MGECIDMQGRVIFLAINVFSILFLCVCVCVCAFVCVRERSRDNEQDEEPLIRKKGISKLVNDISTRKD